MQKITFFGDFQFWLLFFILGLLWLAQFFWEKPFTPFIAETVPPYEVSPVPNSVKKTLPTPPNPQKTTPVESKSTLIVPPTSGTQQEAKPLEAKPLEAKPLEAKPLEVKPLEAKPLVGGVIG